ncbi:RHS repeat-associated core domain-containing protein [Streptomyces sp. NBC_00503]|nr:RHS repeat-associated core domain-containing protein [Streptomyces sp. NBC_00503]WUD85851.1 RHS repeat-associated core domain-containing protein [Streptomyces sp. NBC_00503]
MVGGTTDSTGLTHLGAREYDPTLGRFISVDPIIDTTDPQQMHGYTYGNNNPLINSDPDGNFFGSITNWLKEQARKAWEAAQAAYRAWQAWVAKMEAERKAREAAAKAGAERKAAEKKRQEAERKAKEDAEKRAKKAKEDARAVGGASSPGVSPSTTASPR